uniref:Uncharacterized protein n=1 Tax=Glossina austeni TaxID=7395 RepID=A0A1A9UV97_GLOAU
MENCFPCGQTLVKVVSSRTARTQSEFVKPAAAAAAAAAAVTTVGDSSTWLVIQVTKPILVLVVVDNEVKRELNFAQAYFARSFTFKTLTYFLRTLYKHYLVLRYLHKKTVQRNICVKFYDFAECKPISRHLSIRNFFLRHVFSLSTLLRVAYFVAAVDHDNIIKNYVPQESSQLDVMYLILWYLQACSLILTPIEKR